LAKYHGDINCCVLDWGAYSGSKSDVDTSNTLSVIEAYLQLLSNSTANKVGEGLGQIIEFIHGLVPINLSGVHLIGHSLGAHIGITIVYVIVINVKLKRENQAYSFQPEMPETI
jgi:hypothetical protein